jgi:hypothetical protein
LSHPEVAIEYYTFNVKKGPTANVKVRRAFALAVDRVALAKFRRTTKPLTDFTPEGNFPEIRRSQNQGLRRAFKEKQYHLGRMAGTHFQSGKGLSINARIRLSGRRHIKRTLHGYQLSGR